MATDARGVSEFYFLQPELLNETSLRQILELRCVKLQNMYTMNKEQLLEVFHRVAVPLPQRSYKENRRGKLLTKLRRKQERSILRAENTQQKSDVKYGFSESDTFLHELSQSSCNSHHTLSRLKPPPDAKNFEHKKIRLKSKSSDSVDLESIRIKRLKKFDNSKTNGVVSDRIIIKEKKLEEEEKLSHDTVSGDMKLHGSDSSSSGARKVKLKRSYSTANVESSSSLSTSSSSEAKKHRTIKWP